MTLFEQYGRPVRRRRMALWHVGWAVDRMDLATSAGIRPERRRVGWPIHEDRMTDPVMTLLECEEGIRGLPVVAWEMMLRRLAERAVEAMQGGVLWLDLVRWGWPMEHAAELWGRVSAEPRAQPASNEPPAGDDSDEGPGLQGTEADDELDELLDGLFG